MKFFLVFVALAVFPLLAQAPPWEVGLQYLPSSAASIVTQTVRCQQALFVNADTADHLVTVVDRSTNCNGGACPIFISKLPGTVSGSSPTTYAVPLNGVRATGGVVWSTDASNVVAGWIKGTF